MAAAQADSAAKEAAVLTSGLVRRYGPVTAVDGIDLAVRRGEIYGFLGPNGAGKSSVVRVLCTLLRPSEGRVCVAGFNVVEEPKEVRVRIGVALQEAALDDGQTGRELLALQGRLYGLDRSQIRARLNQVLALVDIGAAIDRRIGTYSGGMKRRLDLAAALVHNPQVLFLDEPTTGLDPISRASVWAEIRRLNVELGMTIFLTTQYLDEADALADRVGIIAKGRLVAEGPPDALKRSMGQDLIVAEVRGDDPTALTKLADLTGIDAVTQEGDQIIVSTSDGAAWLSPVALTLGTTSLAVCSLTLRTPTLDDVFMELTGSHMEEKVIR
ncbi:MAG TPA: ATP-binding cassette domain-containing protein [Acidimicrobiales bacterium]|nr:ATP-binding cassette domain-containing protein [Acidimicrobiales bacterium]